jgi:CBS domain-containing protein
MARLRDLPLVAASVRESASFAEAAEALFRAEVSAIAVVDGVGRVRGVFGERDVLRAVFPGYIRELRHTSFLPDDQAGLDQRRREVADRPVVDFARAVDVLSADESETHAAERFLHAAESALPVVDAGRYLGMLSVAALCRGRTVTDAPA